MLELGRQAREEGLTFEEFWERAVRPGKPALTPRRLGKGPYANLIGAVIWPSDTAERAELQESTARCRETWCRAYNRETPTAGDEAVARLYDIWAERTAGKSSSRAAVSSAAG